ncbi:MAG: DUF3891 family protein [Thermoanaerobaculum sp.]
MIVCRTPEGHLLFPQSAHALLAFQLAEHWGNRTTPRPSPRAEVLAAVLLHDAGWDGRDAEPRLLPGGVLADFARWPQGEEREKLWHDTLAASRRRGRYVEYLVGYHILHLAETYSPGKHLDFVASLRKRLGFLADELAAERRYAQVFRTGQDLTNRHIMRVVDAVALSLCLGIERKASVPQAPFRQGLRDLHLTLQKTGIVRFHPWPFLGRQLTVWVEARFLPGDLPKTDEQLAVAWENAAARALTFRLARLGVAA